MIKKNYTIVQNNHYIQAAWAGHFWGEILEAEKDPRERKIWSLDISGILKNEYKEWPDIELLKENKWLNNYHTAEDVYKSDKILLDNLDLDFADNCENFLQTVLEIEKDVINFHLTKKVKKGILDIYSKDVQIEKVNKIKSYIALHLARTKLSVINSFKRVEDSIINRSSNGFEIVFPKMNDDEIEYLNKQFSPLTENTFKEAKKMVAYHDIKNSYFSYIEDIKKYSHVKFILNYSFENDFIYDTNILTEIPFISGRMLINKEQFKNDFITFLNNNENQIMLDTYGINYNTDVIFIKELDDLFNSFIVGVLSHRIKIFLSKKQTVISNIFSDWFLDFKSNKYEMLAIQNNFSKFIGNSCKNLELFYQLIKNFDIDLARKNYFLVQQILKNPRSLQELKNKGMLEIYTNMYFFIKKPIIKYYGIVVTQTSNLPPNYKNYIIK